MSNKVKCDDCGWTGTESDIIVTLDGTPHLAERLDMGGIVPVGECPKCGALCYLTSDMIRKDFECRYCKVPAGEACIDIWGEPRENHGVRAPAAREKIQREQDSPRLLLELREMKKKSKPKQQGPNLLLKKKSK